MVTSASGKPHEVGLVAVQLQPVIACIQSATARTHSLISGSNELSQKAGGSRVFGCRQNVDVPTDRSV